MSASWRKLSCHAGHVLKTIKYTVDVWSSKSTASYGSFLATSMEILCMCISTMSNRRQTNVWIFKQHYLYKSNGFPSQWTQRTPSCFLSGTKNKEKKSMKSGYPQIINRWLGCPLIKDIWFGDVGFLSPWSVWFAGQVATSWDPLLHDIVRHKPTRRASGNEVLLKKMVGHQTGDHQNPIKCKWCWRVPEFPLLSRKSNKKNMLIMGKMFMNFTPIFFTTKCSPINPIPTIMSTKGTVHPLLQPPVHHHRFVPHDLHSEWSRHHHLHLDFSTRNACYLNSNGPPRLVGVFRVFLWWFV